jgi:serine/threonine-protein phosphatase 2B catalytic subunit
MDSLKDPVNDRQVKALQAPPHKPLSRALMFPDKLKCKYLCSFKIEKPDWKLLKEFLHKEGRIGKEELIRLVSDCNKILKNEGNLIFL